MSRIGDPKTVQVLVPDPDISTHHKLDPTIGKVKVKKKKRENKLFLRTEKCVEPTEEKIVFYKAKKKKKAICFYKEVGRCTAKLLFDLKFFLPFLFNLSLISLTLLQKRYGEGRPICRH